MSLKKENTNKNDNNNKINNNTSLTYYKRKNPNNNSLCISRVMSIFMENLGKKKQILEKEIQMYNNTIINFQKKRKKIMSKNNFLLSMSSSKFPLIESRYKNYTQKQLKNKDNLKSCILIKEKSFFNNSNAKDIKKSKSEYKLNDIDKNKDNKLFQTSIGRNQKLVKFKGDLFQSNDNKGLNGNSVNIESKDINSIINNDENNNNENDNSKMNNIMNRLTKISHLNPRLMNATDEENSKEKQKPINTKKYYTILKASPNKINRSLNISTKGNRRKRFKIEVIKGWEFNNGLNINNINEKTFIEDKEYQKNIISNQIDIIMDNTNYFKLNYINILASYIKNDDINEKFLIILNKLLEETSALYIEISHLIIKDFESFLYVKYKLPACYPKAMVDGLEVTDEKLEFGTNIKILNECTKFLTSSYEIYLVLNTQSNYIIPKTKFLKTRHFLNRARFNINSIVSHSEKYIQELRYEKSIINTFNEQQELIDRNIKLKNRQYSNCDRLSDGMERLQERSQKNKNVIGFDKMRRLNNLLNSPIINSNKNEFFRRKRIIGKHIDLSDKMFNKIVEYMEPHVKERFEAFSVTQKKFGNKNERKVYKFDF